MEYRHQEGLLCSWRIKKCKEEGILTGLLTCNNNSKASIFSENTVETIVGPEVVTGSTRMKSGTAQKLILNMISTSLMIKLGRVKGNKMVDMALSNSKLIDSIRFISDELNIGHSEAKNLLNIHNSVRKAIDNYKKK